MARGATSRLKVNPPLGTLPVLQYCAPEQLLIDAAYQRSLETGPSQSLIRKIAMFWNWDLCQPLVVARRADGQLYVVDGQHRLAAAALRRDIAQLPCVVSTYATAGDEAASFVALNQMRRPLNALDIFKAAVVAEDAEALLILDALRAAGLSLANTTNNKIMGVGRVQNVGGLRTVLRGKGEDVLRVALKVLGAAYPGQVLRFAGTIFPGIAHIVAIQRTGLNADELAQAEQQFLPGMVDMVAAASQDEWARDIVKLSPEVSGGRREAAEKVFASAWSEFLDAYFDEDFEPAVAA